MAKKLPNQDLLQELLHYDPFTGDLTWKERAFSWFTTDGQAHAWNARWAGKPACANLHKATGYLRGTIEGSTYLAHRVIWKLVTGCDPVIIDHDDGIGSNNAWINILDSTSRKNSRNQKIRASNRSGCSGVSWSIHHNKWLVQIGTDTGKQTIGLFNDQEDAITARRGIARILGYTARHGI